MVALSLKSPLQKLKQTLQVTSSALQQNKMRTPEELVEDYKFSLLQQELEVLREKKQSLTEQKENFKAEHHLVQRQEQLLGRLRQNGIEGFDDYIETLDHLPEEVFSKFAALHTELDANLQAEHSHCEQVFALFNARLVRMKEKVAPEKHQRLQAMMFRMQNEPLSPEQREALLQEAFGVEQEIRMKVPNEMKETFDGTLIAANKQRERCFQVQEQIQENNFDYFVAKPSTALAKSFFPQLDHDLTESPSSKKD